MLLITPCWDMRGCVLKCVIERRWLYKINCPLLWKPSWMQKAKTGVQQLKRKTYSYFNSQIPFLLLEVMNAHSLTPVGLTKTLHKCYRPWCNPRAQSSITAGSCSNSPTEGVKCSSPHISPVGRDSAMLDDTRDDTSSPLTVSQFST